MTNFRNLAIVALIGLLLGACQVVPQPQVWTYTEVTTTTIYSDGRFVTERSGTQQPAGYARPGAGAAASATATAGRGGAAASAAASTGGGAAVVGGPGSPGWRGPIAAYAPPGSYAASSQDFGGGTYGNPRR